MSGVVKSGDERALPAKILHQNSVFESIADAFGARTIDDLA
jgi:hypothetical protein